MSLCSDVQATESPEMSVQLALPVIDISNSLRGIFQIQHRRQAYREAAAGSSSALAHIDAGNFPPMPLRVGPSTLPRSIGLAVPVDSENEDEEEPSDNSETAKAGGKKRAAPGGPGQATTAEKKPQTKEPHTE